MSLDAVVVAVGVDVISHFLGEGVADTIATVVVTVTAAVVAATFATAAAAAAASAAAATAAAAAVDVDVVDDDDDVVVDNDGVIADNDGIVAAAVVAGNFGVVVAAAADFGDETNDRGEATNEAVGSAGLVTDKDADLAVKGVDGGVCFGVAPLALTCKSFDDFGSGIFALMCFTESLQNRNEMGMKNNLCVEGKGNKKKTENRKKKKKQ